MQNNNQHKDISDKIRKRLFGVGWQGRQYAYTNYNLEIKECQALKAEATVIINLDGISDVSLEYMLSFFKKNRETVNIITINNGEDSDLATQCSEFAHTALTFKTRIATASAQNVASLFVNTPTIIFISGAYYPDINLVKEFSTAFKDKNIQLARGQICSKERIEHIYLGHPFFTDKQHPWTMDIDECIALRTSIFYRLGGFDERIHSYFFALDFSIRTYAHYPDTAQIIVPKANIYTPKGVNIDDLLFQKQLGWNLLQKKYPIYIHTYIKVWLKYFQQEK